MEQQLSKQGETERAAHLTYARQTRNATVFIAWVVGILVVFSLIMGIFVGVQLSHLNQNLGGGGGGGVSNCMSLGGTDPSC